MLAQGGASLQHHSLLPINEDKSTGNLLAASSSELTSLLTPKRAPSKKDETASCPASSSALLDGESLKFRADTEQSKLTGGPVRRYILHKLQRIIEPFTNGSAAASVKLGLLLFACSTVFVTLMNTCAKLANEDGIPIFQVVLARSVICLLLVLPKIIKDKVDPRGNRRWLLLVRGFAGFGSVTFMFWSVSLLPLSDATVLTFLAPVMVAILAPFLLKEQPSRLALATLPVCLVGVILVAQPSFIFHGQSLSVLGVIMGCIAAFCSGSAKMSVRELRKSDLDPVIMIWMAVLSVIGSGILCASTPAQWANPSKASTWLLLLGTGVCGYGNQLTMTAALRRVAALPAVALSYLSVVWGLLLGVFIFHERPGLLSLGGSAVICCCTLALSMHESTNVKKPSKAPPVDLLRAAGDESGTLSMLVQSKTDFAQQLVRRSSGGKPFGTTTDSTTLDISNSSPAEESLMRESNNSGGSVHAAPSEVSIAISRGWISGEMVGLLGEDVEAGLRKTPDPSSSQLRSSPQLDIIVTARS